MAGYTFEGIGDLAIRLELSSPLEPGAGLREGVGVDSEAGSNVALEFVDVLLLLHVGVRQKTSEILGSLEGCKGVVWLLEAVAVGSELGVGVVYVLDEEIRAFFAWKKVCVRLNHCLGQLGIHLLMQKHLGVSLDDSIDEHRIVKVQRTQDDEGRLLGLICVWPILGLFLTLVSQL